MKYLMLVRIDPDFVPGQEDSPPAIEEWLAEMNARGLRYGGHQICPPSDATTIRRREGEVLVTDGPFAETKDQIAGFDIIDCADLDEAIEISSRHPVAWFGAIELYPFLPIDLLPDGTA